jgi:hypothetical protein
MEYLGEFKGDTVCDKKVRLIDEKTKGRKPRDTVPLIELIPSILRLRQKKILRPRLRFLSFG